MDDVQHKQNQIIDVKQRGRDQAELPSSLKPLGKLSARTAALRKHKGSSVIGTKHQAQNDTLLKRL